MAIANIRYLKTLQQQAIRDPLTGLFNRRYLDETLQREMHQAVRADELLTFALLDVDHFKDFNDAYGHDAGDALLKAVGEVLIQQMRGGDIACRYGGEEFALVYPGMDEDVAGRCLETIKTEIGNLSITHRGKVCKPATISAGLAVYPAHAPDTDSLINAADQALYRSKDAGRNRVSVAAHLAKNLDASPLRVVHGS
jgi:diguanylate cyclase (GGDEF)-like protein